MAYPKNIARLRPTKGFAFDIEAAEVSPEFWTGGNNIQFRDGFAERIGGYTAVYDDIQDDIRALLNVQSSGVNYWLYFGISSVYVVETVNHTNITPLAGLSSANDPNMWTVGLLNGIPFGNNTLDAPIYWGLDTGTEMATLSGWPVGATCRSMVAHRYNLFALGFDDGSTDFPHQIRWSNSAAAGALPTAWTAAATNDAGSASLSATEGEIVHGLALRSSLIVYKTHSAYSVDWIGGQYSYDVRPLFVTAGMLNRNCAVSKDGYHYILSDGDVLITDGNVGHSLIDARMRKYLFNQLDQSNYGAAFVVHHETKNEVWVCFPTSGNTFCDAALVIDTSTGNPLGFRDLPTIACAATGSVNDTAESQLWDDQAYTWDVANSLWNQQTFTEANKALVLGYSNDATPTSSKLFQVDSGDTANGTNISATLTRNYLDLGDPTRMKFVSRIIPRISGTAGTEVSIRVGSADSPEGSETWEVAQTFTIGTSDSLYFTALGKYISVEISSDGVNPWTCEGFDLEYELRGYY